MSTSAKAAGEYWDRTHAEIGAGDNPGAWWATPGLQQVINRRLTGRPDADWVDYVLDSFADRFPTGRSLSLGCGTGELERRLARYGAAPNCDAVDISAVSVEAAARRAEAGGLGGLRYEQADLNHLSLPPTTYDVVWAHMALHHVERLEQLFAAAAAALKPGGLLVANEYIGPSRFQFPPRQRELIRAAHALLPPDMRRRFAAPAAEMAHGRWWRQPGRTLTRVMDKLLDGTLGDAVAARIEGHWPGRLTPGTDHSAIHFPSERDMIANDPSEAVRSGDIVAVAGQHLTLVDRQDWGCGLLHFALNGFAHNFRNGDSRCREQLEFLAQVEERLTELGEVNSDFAVLVWRRADTIRHDP